ARNKPQLIGVPHWHTPPACILFSTSMRACKERNTRGTRILLCRSRVRAWSTFVPRYCACHDGDNFPHRVLLWGCQSNPASESHNVYPIRDFKDVRHIVTNQ